MVLRRHHAIQPPPADPTGVPEAPADPMSDRDPLFARYQSAWIAYQAVQTERHGAADVHLRTPFQQALSNHTDADAQAAARELASARQAYHRDG
jgi:hypothetical protein